MKPDQFLQQLDRTRIETAIAEAEMRTSGEIRVMVHESPVTDALAFAQGEFVRLGMTKTRERNALLLLVAPASQSFAIVGDTAVHEKCGSVFWQELTAAMEEHFRRQDFSQGLIEGIARAGALLAQYFPRQPGDVDELPNDVL